MSEQISESEYGERYREIMTELFDLIEDVSPEEQVRLWKDVHSSACFMVRLLDLTEEEFNHCEGELSDEERKVLDCLPDKERESQIKSLARARYFMECAWLQYLHGETDEKPFSSPPGSKPAWVTREACDKSHVSSEL